MFSSVAHLARANPFHAPHLQLVHDGPPGAPRRSRSLAAAAVEGEVVQGNPGVVQGNLGVMQGTPELVQGTPGRCPRRPLALAGPGMPAAQSLALPQGRGRDGPGAPR